MDGGPRRWGVAGLVAVAALLPRMTPADAVAGLTAQVAPQSLKLLPGDVFVATVVLVNPGSTPATVIWTDVTAPPRVSAGPVTGLPRAIPSGGSVRGRLEVLARPGMRNGTVTVIVDYRQGSATRVVAAALTVEAADAATGPEVTFVAAPDTVNDGQSRGAVVRITNPTPLAYEKVALSAVSSDDLDVQLAGSPPKPFMMCSRALACLDELAPGAAEVLNIRISAHDSVRTGKEKVGIRLTGTPAGGALPATDVVGVTEVGLTVFGVDAIAPLGIGTLFILPGLLAVIVFFLLARYVYPRRPSLPDTVDLKDLRALPVVVPAAALAYLLVWVTWGHNLTVAVSTSDVGRLFGFGVGIGWLAWAVMACIWYLYVGRKQFTSSDSPDRVLKRLAARKSRLTLPEAAVSGVRHLFLTRSADGKLLMSPQLAYTILGDPQDPATADRATAFRTALDGDDIDAVRAAAKAGHVRLQWEGGSGLTEIDDVGVVLGSSQRLLHERE